jgi:hypothetical protein
MYMNRTISRVLAAAVASAGFAVPLPTIAGTISCTGATFSATPDGQGNITVSCTAPGTTTSTCSISVSPSVLTAAGGTVSVSTSCGANASVAGGKAVSQSGTNSWTDTIGANGLSTNVSFTYTVTGDGGTRSATVTQSGTGGGTSPPPGGTISCNGFSKTHVLDLAWGAPASAAPRVLTSSAGGFSGGEIVVARFTTPASSAAGIYAQIKSAEWGDQQHQRIASLAASPCEFSTGLGRLAMTTVATPSPAITYAVGGSSSYYAILKPSTTYYFNIKNVDCAVGESCNMFVELQKPKGL